MADIECFFDCSSPWTDFAFESLLRLQQELGATVAWRPILVGGVFNAVNPSVHDSRAKPVPLKEAYGKKDQNDWARYLGIRMHYRPSVFPVNSVKAMRACIFADRQGKLVALARAVFQAYWGEDRDISLDAELRPLFAKVGLDPDQVFQAIGGPEIKAALKANTDELVARGGYGSPTFFVGGTDMYFGNDRLPLIEAALERAKQAAA